MHHNGRATTICCIAVLYALTVLSPTHAISVSTHHNLHKTVGSDVTLYCGFWSSEYVSDLTTLSWRFRPDNSREIISIFHYGNGVPYIEKWGQFRGRVEWVGDISKHDGSIVIRNLDYIDNGTFTCDVKNPPDVVGTSSDVHLTVYDRIPPIGAGVVSGAIIGTFLGIILLIVGGLYLFRYVVRRRARSETIFFKGASAAERGKASGKSGTGTKGPVLYATLDQSKSGKGASEKKAKTSESKRERK
ncbi:myelin protein P0 [Pristis pectinata]|uniref:myelin protein P0 n=1 Tax=Pristis pectinata TaxID=685728 RepID=UPI00223CAC49|nr:myelin protein P0 [Pristis pectinata]